VEKLTAYDDQILLQRLAEGDERAFDELFVRHWDHVYSAAFLLTKSSQLAHDIAQDTFLTLWKNREQLNTINNLKGFLYTHVKFMVYKRFRRLKVEDAYASYLRQKTAADTGSIPEAEGNLRYKELRSTIEKGISQLPPQQQLAFKLSREEGLTHEQISELMGISKKTVKDYIVRSIAFLRPYIKQYSSVLVLLFSDK